ncbi:hypothetical protein [Chitinophaga nivalis]|uniref:Uncharacterized protein n=1 Tax=Chitinophaga nivalis TaxID=2991709 RepID=A0ABT3IT44_9BACT|nr:hypothetical protein [Chitinophaga nivalis]MCW3463157.1 hypothetical protein [Chitinophaga nivalis]MCW3487153.1 hypothetical protein [Chitinophaga nivalis]
MKNKVLEKIKDINEKAKALNEIKINSRQHLNSLAEHIQTKEQAEIFKKLVKSL